MALRDRLELRCARPAWAGIALLVAATQAAAFDLQGHRGARALAPENTLAGFRLAAAIGVTTLELDLGVSRDGQLVISHDPRLNPDLTRDAAGLWIAAPGPALNTLTAEELQRHDVGRLKPGTRYAAGFARQQPHDGERIPTLQQLFDEVARWGARELRFNIEIKMTPGEPALTPPPEEFALKVVDLVRRFGLDERVTVQSFDWRAIRAVQAIAPQLRTAALTVRSRNFDNLADGRWTAGLQLADHGGSVPALVKAAGATVWSPNVTDLSASAVKEARSLGLQVVPWTVNDADTMQRLLDWGVDGLITDDPVLAREVLAGRGVALPPPYTTTGSGSSRMPKRP
jgi:glycerophosphoryl diester phosphodiesterase